MSLLELTETELRSQLALQLDQLTREQLLSTHLFVSRMIANELIDSVSQDWQQELVTSAAISKAIAQHRAARPYGDSHS